MITREIAEATHPTKPLGEVAAFLDHKRRPVKQSERKHGIFPYYGANGLQGTIDSFIFDEPLILLAEDGGHFDDPDRGIAYEISGKTWVNNHAHVLNPRNSDLDLTYLRRVLENYDVRPFINGSTRSKLTKAQAERIPIPLPPLDEQRRIAAILDKADALRRKRKRALDLLDGLTQSIFLEMFDQQKYPILDLKEVVKQGTIVTYGIVQAGPEYAGGVPYIRTGDLVDGRIQIDGLKRTNPAIAARCSSSRVEAGDIVMSIRATVGTTAIVPPKIDGANLTQGTARIAPGEPIQRNYLIEYLRSQKIQRWIAAQGKGATFLEITLGRLRELPVAVPPVELQNKFSYIVEKVRQDRTKCLSQALFAKSLFSSLQSRAFAGQL